jgi:hypothetical protein
VAWVLATVFVRFCEDNRLVAPVWISGPAHRRQEALDAQAEFTRREAAHRDVTDRHWLVEAIRHLSRLPATAALVDESYALWDSDATGDGASGGPLWREPAGDHDDHLNHRSPRGRLVEGPNARVAVGFHDVAAPSDGRKVAAPPREGTRRARCGAASARAACDGPLSTTPPVVDGGKAVARDEAERG